MIAELRQKAIVGAGGRVEIQSPELPEGARVEVIVFMEPIQADLEAGYRAMAQDEEREREALEWAEATLGDVSHET